MTLSTDVFVKLRELAPSRRAKLLNLEANFGFSSAERKFIEALLGPDFELRSWARQIELSNGWQIPTDKALELELEEEVGRYLAGTKATTQGSWALALQESQVASAIRCVDKAAANMPLAPWSVLGNSNLVPLRSPTAYQTLSGSLRTFDLIEESQHVATFKYSLARDRISVLQRSFLERLKRLGMDVLFGVERNVDPGLVERLDALHCLYVSHYIASREHELPRWMEVQKETAAISDGAGHTCLLREPSRLVQQAGEGAIVVPYFSLVFSRRKKKDVFQMIVAESGYSEGDLATKLIELYLGAWWELFATTGVIHLMPHAQNASLAIDKTSRPVGIVLKDLRDADLVSRYRRHTHRSVRLHPVSASYLNYEMCVHPSYHDASSKQMSLEEKVFSFTFQMLRNHVVRGLLDSIRDRAAARLVERRFVSMVIALAEGWSASELSDLPLAQNVGTTQASRALRTRFAKTWKEFADD